MCIVRLCQAFKKYGPRSTFFITIIFNLKRQLAYNKEKNNPILLFGWLFSNQHCSDYFILIYTDTNHSPFYQRNQSCYCNLNILFELIIMLLL